VKDEHARALAEQRHMVDLELAKMELKYARTGLEYQREMRHDEGQLEDVEEKIKKLEGEAKEEALRLRRRLRVAVNNAKEEIELIDREFDVEKQIRRALSKREQAKMQLQQKKDLLKITGSLNFYLQRANGEVDQIRREHAKKKADLAEELARYQAELTRMEKADTSKSHDHH